MKKKLIMLSLALLSVVCLFMAYSCQNVTASFNDDYNETLYVGKEVDLEELIVRQKGTTTKIEISYDVLQVNGQMEKTTEKFIGHDTIFYPKVAGKHVIKYTVYLGDKSNAVSKTVTVEYPEPELEFANVAYGVQLDRKTTSKKLNLGFIARSADVNMIYENADANTLTVLAWAKADEYNPMISLAEHTFAADQPVDSLSLSPSFTFTEDGLYRFKAQVATNMDEDAKTTTAYFYVLVTKGEISKTYKSSVNDQGVVTIKAGKSALKGGAWTTDYGYYGLGNYSVGDTLTINFTGKNIPNVGILTDLPSGQPVGGGTGLVLNTSLHDATYSNRFVITGPNRIETGVISDYATYDKYNLGKNESTDAQRDLSYLTNQSLFSYNHLTDGVDYRYTISTTLKNKKTVTVSVKLEEYIDGDNSGDKEWVVVSREFDKNGTPATSTASKSFDVEVTKLPALYGTYAIAYSAGNSIGKPVSFTYNITTTSRTAGLYRNSDTREIELANANSFYTAGVSNLATDTIVSTFYGNNVPVINLYADKADGTSTKGLTLSVEENATEIYVGGSKTGTPVTFDAIKGSTLEASAYYSLKITQERIGTKLKLTVQLNEYDFFTETHTEITKFTTEQIECAYNAQTDKYIVIFGKGDTPISASCDVERLRDEFGNFVERIYLTQDNFASELAAATEGTYYLTEDITLTGNWTKGKNFSGILDGQGHKITGLSLSGNNQGIFHEFTGTIKNIVIEGTIASGSQSGLIAQDMRTGATLENVVVKADLKSGQYNGAICSIMQSGNITLNNVIVIATSARPSSLPQAGFIAGRARTTFKANVNGCYFIAANKISACGEGGSGYYTGDTAGAGPLCATQEDATNHRYTNFIVGENYSVYYDASSLATATTAFEKAVTLSGDLATLYAKLK